MLNRFTQLNDEQINQLFKTSYFRYIPIEYIDYIKIHYSNNVVKQYNRAQISNKIDETNEKYAKIHSIYNEDDIEDIQISLRHDKLVLDVNTKLCSWYEEIVQAIKSED